MSTSDLTCVLGYVRRLAGANEERDPSDGELLEGFCTQHEETALAILVQRHGPMVLAVCRRMVDDANDAEDVFQATFLVLARRAKAIRKQESVASWLHGVARRIAHKARLQATRRRSYERRWVAMAHRELVDELTWQELRKILDEELSQVP